MNKLFGDGKGGKVVCCVLEPGNIKKLVENREPIVIDLNDGPYKGGLPAKLKVEIFYSETPIADAKSFAEMLKPDGFVEDRRMPVTLTKKPHCAECHSVIEQLMVWKQEGSPWVVCCANCGAAFGCMPPMPGIKGTKV